MRLFESSVKTSKRVSIVSSLGIGPLKLLFVRLIVWRLVRRKSTGGIGPAKGLESEPRLVRPVRLLIAGSREPAKPKDSK